MTPPSPTSKEAHPLGRLNVTGGICDLRSRMKFLVNTSSTPVGNEKSLSPHQVSAVRLTGFASQQMCPRDPAAFTSTTCTDQEERGPPLCILCSLNSSHPFPRQGPQGVKTRVGGVQEGGEDALTRRSRPSWKG